MNQSAAPHVSRRWPWILFVVLLACLGAWWWAGESDEGAGPAVSRYAGPVPVRVVEAEQGTFAVESSAIGTVTSLATVQVRAKVDGELKEILFEEGQMVKAGDVLAVIDPQPYEIRLRQAKGQLQQNQAQLQNAEADLRRYQLLHKQDSIARQQLDSQQALVRQHHGMIQTLEAQVADAQLQLDYTRIKAPVSGRLGLRRIDPGNMVRESDADGLVTITQLQPISVLFSIPETQLSELLPALESGGEQEVQAWDRGERRMLEAGILRTIDNQIDIATGTIRLRAEFPNEGGRLFPNQFVNVRLTMRSIENAVSIPVDTVQYGSQGTYVYTVDAENKARVRPVRLGPQAVGRVVVEEGLQPGEKAVLEGLDRLREGREVRLMGEDEPAAPASDASAAGGA